MENVIHTKLSEGRRVAIPAELCQRYGIEPGDPVVLEPSATGIVMRPLDAVIREVQAYLRRCRSAGRGAVGGTDPRPPGGSRTGQP